MDELPPGRVLKYDKRYATCIIATINAGIDCLFTGGSGDAVCASICAVGALFTAFYADVVRTLFTVASFRSSTARLSSIKSQMHCAFFGYKPCTIGVGAQFAHWLAALANTTARCRVPLVISRSLTAPLLRRFVTLGLAAFKVDNIGATAAGPEAVARLNTMFSRTRAPHCTLLHALELVSPTTTVDAALPLMSSGGFVSSRQLLRLGSLKSRPWKRSPYVCIGIGDDRDRTPFEGKRQRISSSSSSSSSSY